MFVNYMYDELTFAFISGFMLFLKESIHVYCLSIIRAKLSSLCIICFWDK